VAANVVSLLYGELGQKVREKHPPWNKFMG